MSKRGVLVCTIVCNACESEFELQHRPDETINNPIYCPFCGENIEDDYPAHEED